MHIESVKTHDFCMLVCFALIHSSLSCLHTCMLSSDIKGANRQNIRKYKSNSNKRSKNGITYVNVTFKPKLFFSLNRH